MCVYAVHIKKSFFNYVQSFILFWVTEQFPNGKIEWERAYTLIAELNYQETLLVYPDTTFSRKQDPLCLSVF